MTINTLMKECSQSTFWIADDEEILLIKKSFDERIKLDVSSTKKQNVFFLALFQVSFDTGKQKFLLLENGIYLKLNHVLFTT